MGWEGGEIVATEGGWTGQRRVSPLAQAHMLTWLEGEPPREEGWLNPFTVRAIFA